MNIEKEFVERIHRLASSAYAHNKFRVDAITQLRTAVREMDRIMDEAMPHVVGGCQATSTVLYLCQEKLGIAVPVSEDAKKLSGSGSVVRTAPTKTILVVLLAGLASLAVGAGFTRSEGSHVTGHPYPSTALECARDALRQGNHHEALKYYKQVCDPTPEALFGRAQCQFRLNEYDDALATCDTLDLVTGGTGWESPLVRGWIAERRGHKVMAYEWYIQSAKRGNQKAEILAERVK